MHSSCYTHYALFTVSSASAVLQRTALLAHCPHHSYFALSDAVLVGIETVYCDNPQLNVRDPLPGVPERHPRPIVIDSSLRIADCPHEIRLVSPIVCTCVRPNEGKWDQALEKLRRVNGTLITCRMDPKGR
jgi:riboflavin biosynthesis pyrimidine reductase